MEKNNVERTVKKMHIVIIINGIEMMLYPESIEKDEICKEILFRRKNCTALNIKHKDFKHKLRYKFTDTVTGCDFYQLNL